VKHAGPMSRRVAQQPRQQVFTPLSFEISDEFFDRIGKCVSALLEDRFGAQPAEWLTVAGAAGHLQTTEDGIRALVKRRRIPHYRGAAGRLLFDRAELDTWVRGESH
jgi:excisionase family DNA binding protein